MDRSGINPYRCDSLELYSPMNPGANFPLKIVWRGLTGLALLLSAASAQARDAPDPAPLELTPCALFLPGTGLTAPAECGWLEVAENPARPEGKHIRLRVARVPAQGRKVEPDPLVLFAGGPGQAASEAWLIIAPALKKLNENRDVLLIDQRGTGQSNALRCPQASLEETLAIDWQHIEETTRACLAALPGDPRFYTTTIAMQDYDRVRAALGYERLNLLGVSYGTRAAQVYLRLFPQRVRTIVLDSVVPQTLPLGSEHSQKLDQAVAKVIARCDADAGCAKAFPDTAGNLDLLIRELEEAPVPLIVDHPLTGRPFPLEFDRETLATAIRFMAYAAETQAILPLLIHEAATTGGYQRLASQMLITATNLTESIAQGMELSVVCSEDFPLFPAEGEGQSGILMGDSMLKATRLQCAAWPRGEVPEGFHDPVQSDKPALLLSGEYDPVTPPEYGAEVSQYFSNSLHLVAPGQGHSVTGKGCLGRLVEEFIAAADWRGLDTRCVTQLQNSPWFMTLTGPTP